jgi:hypothetical protein
VTSSTRSPSCSSPFGVLSARHDFRVHFHRDAAFGPAQLREEIGNAAGVVQRPAVCR